ncbi:hypothetical protein G7Y31_00145 [Corynebacterium lizhenjunii]|uniref:Uncharacterized protein n=1 Tax=Corynebacterium lizhenjunii TaxID=2709394 RepID=A0A7T0KFT6_9CORY|nr:hypothetical protein [Corynebacterium lizhenjunii]QPK79189.1 hypothetical protein G7Y31_00145 [Corynebacterium lizhenjunii]
MFVVRREDPQMKKKIVAQLKQATRYEDLNKDQLREYLLLRQGSRCAYCEQKINNKQHSKKAGRVNRSSRQANKIEHFHPQSQDYSSDKCEKATGVGTWEQSPLALENMLAVCDGRIQEGGTEYCCDTKKASKDICSDFLNPNRFAVAPSSDQVVPRRSLVRVKRDGKLVPNKLYFTDEEQEERAQRVLDEVLNLNSTQLKDSRRKLLVALVKQSNEKVQRQAARKHGISRQELRKKLFNDAIAREEEESSALISVYYSYGAELDKS